MKTEIKKNPLIRTIDDFPGLEYLDITLPGDIVVRIRELTAGDQIRAEKEAKKRKLNETESIIYTISMLLLDDEENGISKLTERQLKNLSMKSLSKLAKAFGDMNTINDEKNSGDGDDDRDSDLGEEEDY
jgi:phage FluMu protein gp41